MTYDMSYVTLSVEEARMRHPLKIETIPDGGELAFFRRLQDASKWAQEKRVKGEVMPPSWSREVHLWIVKSTA